MSWNKQCENDFIVLSIRKRVSSLTDLIRLYHFIFKTLNLQLSLFILFINLYLRRFLHLACVRLCTFIWLSFEQCQSNLILTFRVAFTMWIFSGPLKFTVISKLFNSKHRPISWAHYYIYRTRALNAFLQFYVLIF